MKIISVKKILPGTISLIIIAGMAIQSFATNVDMAAFVNKDKYIDKYYEIDWRIDEIDKSIERMYKFVCTNVKTWVGSGSSSTVTGAFWNKGAQTRSYHWNTAPHAEFSQEGYLRVNLPDTLNTFTGHNKVDVFTMELPAAKAIWREGIELYPETKIMSTIRRTYPNTASVNQNETFNCEIVMGPFKKFPHISTNSWTGGAIFFTKEKFFPIWSTNPTKQYQYNSRTLPTSWRTMSTGQIAYTTTMDNGQSITAGFPGLNLVPSLQDYSDNIYSIGPEYQRTTCVMYVSTVFDTNLSSYKDIWLRFYANFTDQTYWDSMDSMTWNLTTWNNNK